MQWSKEKQKGEGRERGENKQAPHCDREYAAVTELNLRKVHKNFVCATRAADGHSLLQSAMPAFYSSNHGTAGNDFKLNSSKHLWLLLHCKPLYLADDSATMHLVKLTMAVPTMLTSHAPTEVWEEHRWPEEKLIILSNECMVQRPLGEKRQFLLLWLHSEEEAN